MPFEGAVGGDVDISIAALFASLWRSWRKLLVVALVMCALAFILASLMTPKYRAETHVIIETQELIFTRADTSPNADAPILSPQGVKSQVEVMRSTDLLKKVAAKLDLAAYKEFDPVANLNSIDRILILLGLENDPSEMPKDERVLDAVRKRLEVYNVDKSRVIVIQFSSKNRRLAAAVPNAIADEYIALQEAAKRESNSQATSWLGPEIADLTKNVKDAESKVARYRASTGLFMGQNNTVLPTQRLSEIASELSRVQANRAASEAKAATVRAALKEGADLDTLPDVAASPLIQRLREQKVQLKSQIADLSTTLLDGHPRIKALKSQLADINAQIKVEARKVLEGIENAAQIARRREADLTQELNQLKAQSAQAGEEQVELDALQRNADAQRQLLQSYMTRYREAASRENHHYLPADARVFSRAIVPGDPYFPKKLPIVATTFIITLLLGAIFVLLRELFSGRALVAAGETRTEAGEVRMAPAPAGHAEERTRASNMAPAETREERRMIATPVMEPAPVFTETTHTQTRGSAATGEVSDNTAANERPGASAAALDAASGASLEPSDADLAEFTVASVARHLIRKHAPRAFVVSPEGDEGSAAAVLLARELADRGLRVILLDLTGSGIIGELMVEGERVPGITDLLASEKQFTDIIHSDHYSEAHVIPAGLADPAKAMRAVDRLPIIVNALQSAYDIVVVECGPADIDGFGRLVTPGTEVVVSVVDPEDERIVAAAGELQDAGYSDIVFMTSFGSIPAPEPLGGKMAELRTAAHS